jgi:chromosome partitioning protein
MTAFYRMILKVASEQTLVLVDIGPNLGAINRAALIASSYMVIPVGADLFSLQGLRNLGPTISRWRDSWTTLIPKAPAKLEVPSGKMQPIGYVVSQHGVRESRPVVSYSKWIAKIPKTYRQAVLGQPDVDVPESISDPYALAHLKHYRSLMPLAMTAQKPMFALKTADGAIGSHLEAVKTCYRDFLGLAKQIGARVGIDLD